MLLRRLVSTTSPCQQRLPPTIRQLLQQNPESSSSGTHTVVSGWIQSIRKQKNVSFAVITDGSSSKGLQTVLLKGKDDEQLLRQLTNGAAVRVTGQLVPSKGSGQAVELLVDESQNGQIQVLGECDPLTYPIQKKALTPEYLRDHVHLRARTANVAAMLRTRDALRRRIDNVFEDQGFTHIHTPVITGNDAEGAGEAFRLSMVDNHHPAASDATQSPVEDRIEFFSRPAFLTVSHQLHLEAIATALSRVYTLSPCFRAEPSQTSRHLAEFWMLEAEWAIQSATNPYNGVEEICQFSETLLRESVGTLLASEDLQLLGKDMSEVKQRSLSAAFEGQPRWARMTYTDAIKELDKAPSSANFSFQPKWGAGLQSEHERYIAEQVVKGPVFITHYPASIKPFYMRASDADQGRTVECFDLLIPHIGELIGGSVREERWDILKRRMDEAGLLSSEEAGYEWYLDLRKYGSTPHGGFGMGFERLISWITGQENVRECITMPRWAGRMLL
ncbi:hypothetical protein CVT24_012944 [Panaeolus cyanescens]|uniref:Asparagine--tRNA ligase, mitochondrial n=1 Tax=Panaeolus cyanescens TaxID=181874 RepID=A0A409W6E1_9AGAR|nr:hypothetical protein CVT24_012944 [Panaeolus cyanescens]